MYKHHKTKQRELHLICFYNKLLLNEDFNKPFYKRIEL